MNTVTHLYSNIRLFFKNKFQTSWFFQRIDISVRSGFSIIIFLILLISLVIIFYLCNQVPTREFDLNVELLKTQFEYKDNNGSYSEPYADLTIEIPMSMQSERFNGTSGYLHYTIGPKNKNIDKDSTLLDRYFYTYNFNTERIDTIVYDNPDNLLSFHYYNKKQNDIFSRIKPQLLNEINNDNRIDNTYKANVFFIDFTQKTNERLFGIFRESESLQEYSSTTSNDKCYCIQSLTGNKDSIRSKNLYGSSLFTMTGDVIQNRGALATPGWFNLSDISQSYFNIKLSSATINNFTITINFRGVSQFSVLDPVPDKINMSSITYYNLEKISKIKKDGLKFHVIFPELQNKQTVRTFALTAIMSVIFTFIISDLILLSINAWRRKKKKN